MKPDKQEFKNLKQGKTFKDNHACDNFKSASPYTLVWFYITCPIIPCIVLHSALLPLRSYDERLCASILNYLTGRVCRHIDAKFVCNVIFAQPIGRFSTLSGSLGVFIATQTVFPSQHAISLIRWNSNDYRHCWSQTHHHDPANKTQLFINVKFWNYHWLKVKEEIFLI